MNKPKIKVKEITVSLSGVIPIAAYENLRPGYSMTLELDPGQSAYEAMVYCQNHLRQMLQEETDRSRADAIEKKFSKIGFRTKGNKKYPRVSSILGWNINWERFGISELDLPQYASRGNILEAICQHYLESGEWIDPRDVPELEEDIAVLRNGSKGFTWEDCSYKVCMEKFAEKIEMDTFQQVVYNDEHNYTGAIDIVG